MAKVPPTDRFPCLLSNRANVAVIEKINKKLSVGSKKMFQMTCLGHFLSMSSMQFQGVVYAQFLFSQDNSDSVETIKFYINNGEIEFGPREFALVTGLCFGPYPRIGTDRGLHQRIFKGLKSVLLVDIEKAFMSCTDDEDQVKLALLMVLGGILLPRGSTSSVKAEYIKLCDDLDAFNAYPWGRVAYSFLLTEIRRLTQMMVTDYKRIAAKPSHKVRGDANGFTYALLAWAYEAIPLLGEIYGGRMNEEREDIPRILRWKPELIPRLSELRENIFKDIRQTDQNALHIVLKGRLEPLKIEKESVWYKRVVEWEDETNATSEYSTPSKNEGTPVKPLLQILARIEERLASIETNSAQMEDRLKNIENRLCVGDQQEDKASQDEAVKQKEALVNEVACLRVDLQQVRDDCERQLLRVLKYKEFTGKFMAELDSLTTKTHKLTTCLAESDQIRQLQEQLSLAQKKLQLSDISALETIKSEFEDQKALILELKNRLADAEVKVVEGERVRKKLHNQILELKGNIRVFCRVRPLQSEDGVSAAKAVSFPTSTEVLGQGIDLSQNGQKHYFTFDKVFKPDDSQESVFVEISQLVQSALDGYKVCVFAYGQTGSGKTYTMMGKPEPQDQKGLIPRSLEKVFQAKQILESQGWKYEMKVSMLEIYNETIRDLLAPNKSGILSPRVLPNKSSKVSPRVLPNKSGKVSPRVSSPSLLSPKALYAIHHDSNGNTTVRGLTVEDCHSSQKVFELLERAIQSRSVSMTQMNEESSRSHFVFTLRIEGVNEGTDQKVQGVLNLIDLAGSERLSKSGSTGDVLKETQAINKSLSALNDAICALTKKELVPFRNSKLTFLLKTCLSGDSKVLMFVNISPEASFASESLCSLRFAARANACELRIQGTKPS